MSTALLKLAMKLSTEQRDSLPVKEFALSGRRYPIHDISHARAALSMGAKHATPAEYARIRAKVHRRFPEIGQG